MSSSGSTAVWTIAAFAIGCAVSEPIDLKANVGSQPAQPTTDGSVSATGGNRPTSQGSGGGAGVPGGNGSGGINGGAAGGASNTGGTAGTAGGAGRGASGGASGRGGGSGHGGLAGASSGGGRGGGGGGGAAGLSTAPTFTEIYKSILSVDCGGSNCHYPGSQHGVGFSTQSGAYKSLVSVAVVPGDAQGSIFYTDVATGAMPDGKPMLSSVFIDEIGAWIDAGALNN